jgi:hypothetical protein
VLVLLAVLAGAVPAVAGSISIGLTPVPILQDGKLTVALTVGNSGDEAARAVSPVLRLRDREARGATHDALAPRQTLEETLSLPAADLGSGTWPYRLAVDYTDANSYPFQALHVATVTSGNVPPAKIAVQEISAARFSASTTLHMRVKNLSPNQRTMTVAVYVPEGLEVDGGLPAFELGPWEQRDLSTRVINRTVLAGSRYPVFVTAEYDDGSLHQAVVGFGLVEIIPAGSFFSEQRNLLSIAAVVLVAGWLVILGWRARRKAA